MKGKKGRDWTRVSDAERPDQLQSDPASGVTIAELLGEDGPYLTRRKATAFQGMQLLLLEPPNDDDAPASAQNAPAL